MNNSEPTNMRMAKFLSDNKKPVRWNHTWPHHAMSKLQKNDMSTPLKSGYNSSYKGKTEASDIIQSRRTSGKESGTPHVSTDLYILPPALV